MTREIFLSKKNPKSQSYWLPLLRGNISATGAPSKKSLHNWIEKGATDVVTLLRKDEMEKWLPNACEKKGVNWHHYPLSGKHLSDPNDILTLKRTSEMPNILNGTVPCNLVVHCAAGMHRTGVFLYFVLRNANVAFENIVPFIREIRELTAEELVRPFPQGSLLDKSKKIYSDLFITK